MKSESIAISDSNNNQSIDSNQLWSINNLPDNQLDQQQSLHYHNHHHHQPQQQQQQQQQSLSQHSNHLQQQQAQSQQRRRNHHHSNPNQPFADMNKDDDDDDDFQDAKEDFYEVNDELDVAYLDAQRALDFFFDNKFEEAIEICQKYIHVSPVHGMMLTFFHTFFALFSLAKDDLEKATKTLEQAVLVNNRHRRQNNFSQNVSNFFFKPNYFEYTEVEIYCEFIAAFYDLIDFILILFGHQTIISLIKAAIKIRSSSNRLKLCEDIYAQRKKWNNEKIRSEFEAGLCVGNGMLNLVFSHMPSRVMSVLSVMGFSCDRQKGIDLLDRCFSKRNCLPNVFAGYAIMFYNLYVEQILGLGEGNIEWAKAVSRSINSRYPNSICGIFFTARIRQVMGKPAQAIAKFKLVTEMKDIKCNNIANICYWDMIWCYALLGDYENAAAIAKHLSEVCSWSPATNMYQCAVFTYAHAVKTGDLQLMETVHELMATVPRKRIRYAGKTIPPEKFAVTRAETYLRDQYLPAPHLELLDVWNVYSNGNAKPRLLEPMLNELEAEINKFKPSLNEVNVKLDDYALLLKIKAAVYRNLGHYDQAIRHLNQIFQLQDRLAPNSYVLPNAACDLGLTYVCLNDTKKAKHWLNLARNDYTGYLAETIVHFRVHNGLRHLRVLESGYEEEQIVRTYGGEVSDESDRESMDEGFIGSSHSAASSQHLMKETDDVVDTQPQVKSIANQSNITFGVSNLNGPLRKLSLMQPESDSEFASDDLQLKARSSPINRSTLSSTCVNTLGSTSVQGQKSLARALGGGSVQVFRRDSMLGVDSPDGKYSTNKLDHPQLKRKKSRPILKRVKQKIVNKLRSGPSVEQQLIQEQLEQDLKRTRTRSTTTDKQLKRRFTDWF